MSSKKEVKSTPAAKTTPAAAPAKAAPPAKATPTAVPESVLKKRKTSTRTAEEKEKARKALLLKRRVSRRDIFKRAEKYAFEYKRQEKQLVALRRQARHHGNFYAEPQAKLVFVVRIRGIVGLHPKPRKILQLLRLRQINNGTFIRLTKATAQMLKLIEPYITYGYPNVKTVRELVYKRGFAKVGHERLPITDNSIIEKHLGKHGIVCVEDVIHELYTVGPHFKEVNSFMWPFKLSAPTGGWRKVTTHVVEGGDTGNREDKINSLVKRMN